MNKIDIIQRLLDERHITAKEALVLMEKEVCYYPVDHYPVYPNWPPYPVTYDRNGGDYVDRNDYVITSQN